MAPGLLLVVLMSNLLLVVYVFPVVELAVIPLSLLMTVGSVKDVPWRLIASILDAYKKYPFKPTCFSAIVRSKFLQANGTQKENKNTFTNNANLTKVTVFKLIEVSGLRRV